MVWQSDKRFSSPGPSLCLKPTAMWLLALVCYICICNTESFAEQFGEFYPNSDKSHISMFPNVTFHIYNHSSYSPDSVSNVDSLLPRKPLTIVFHGFQGSITAKSMIAIKEALLLKKVENVVIMDWMTFAKSKEFVIFNYESVKNVGLPIAAKAATRWLKNVLKLKNISPRQVHLIGFSLGAHLAGIVGFNFNSTIGRITGLDPPAYGFTYKPLNLRLDESDAEFVNVIHTTTTDTSLNCVGYNQPIGHVDFFPNQKGFYQPHCFYLNPKEALTCSHYFAFHLLVESIFNDKALMAKKCTSWDQYNCGECDSAERVPMGYATPSSERGSFYMKTHEGPPFGEENSENPLPVHVLDLLAYDGTVGVFKPCNGSHRSYKFNLVCFVVTVVNLAKILMK